MAAPAPSPTNCLQINAIQCQIAGLNTKTSESHMRFGGGKGFSDFHTFQYDAAGRERFFLITQCKPPGGETRISVWNGARDQLIDYFNLQHKKRPAGPVYGIAAVGRRVRFYKYDFATRNVVAWRPGENGPPPLPGTGDQRRDFYAMVGEVDRVQDALNWLRDHH